jgi:hypothetical protein
MARVMLASQNLSLAARDIANRNCQANQPAIMRKSLGILTPVHEKLGCAAYEAGLKSMSNGICVLYGTLDVATAQSKE